MDLAERESHGIVVLEPRPEVSPGSNVIDFPVRPGFVRRDSVHDLVFAIATADDLTSAVDRLAEWLGRNQGVSGVELWGTGDDGAPELVAAAGSSGAKRHDLTLGPAGVLALYGGGIDVNIDSTLSSALPILRRRVAEERLTRTAMLLARRNEALEDFAGLVAHELKAPLQAALVADDPSAALDDALDLVEGLLEAAQNESIESGFTSVAESLGVTADDLRSEITITVDPALSVPLPPKPLRVILRNLLSNAISAGAHRVQVTAEHSGSSFRLFVDDDGVGLGDADHYASGSGLGLTLSRRIAGRFGGRLELAPHAAGGTRAILELVEAHG
jgi:signal transduction histidine kinase